MLDAEVRTLQKVPMFRDVDTRRLRVVAYAAQRMSYDRGDRIFAQGDAADMIYVIVDGEVDLMFEGKGEPVRIARLKPGESFGEMGVLTDEARSLGAFAGSACTILELPKSEFLGLVRDIPQLSMAVIRDLARRLQTMNARLAAADGK